MCSFAPCWVGMAVLWMAWVFWSLFHVIITSCIQKSVSCKGTTILIINSPDSLIPGFQFSAHPEQCFGKNWTENNRFQDQIEESASSHFKHASVKNPAVTSLPWHLGLTLCLSNGNLKPQVLESILLFLLSSVCTRALQHPPSNELFAYCLK